MKQRKRGRPPLARGGMRRTNISLDDKTAAKAKRLGQGNLSRGLREAVRRARET